MTYKKANKITFFKPRKGDTTLFAHWPPYTLGELLDELHSLKVNGVPDDALVTPKIHNKERIGNSYQVEWTEEMGGI